MDQMVDEVTEQPKSNGITVTVEGVDILPGWEGRVSWAGSYRWLKIVGHFEHAVEEVGMTFRLDMHSEYSGIRCDFSETHDGSKEDGDKLWQATWGTDGFVALSYATPPPPKIAAILHAKAKAAFDAYERPLLARYTDTCMAMLDADQYDRAATRDRDLACNILREFRKATRPKPAEPDEDEEPKRVSPAQAFVDLTGLPVGLPAGEAEA